MSKHTGIYPGTFDPITKGHLDIIGRATRLVDHLIVAVADNDAKAPMFSKDERVALIEADLPNLKDPQATIEVVAFDSLLMHFAEERNAAIIIRGLRAISDFEYEFQMVGMNARLNDQIETAFLMSQDRYQFISSRFVKEIGRLNGDISAFVSPHVQKALKSKYSSTN